MSDRFFLDTNIFVYSFDDTDVKKARRASELIQSGVTTRKGVVSYQVVQEFLNVALRKFAQPMSAAEAEQYLSTVFRPLLAIHSSHSLFSEAVQLTGRHRLSWYDSLIVAAALASECDILYSEDLQHGRRFGSVQVKNPFV
ncbi:MAG TPA: PIN domain-containing protein [Candidatus Angelobacter sp.]|nr:PIN domain-containing protein [Candidatus Angelobacter sp.]